MFWGKLNRHRTNAYILCLGPLKWEDLFSHIPFLFFRNSNRSFGIGGRKIPMIIALSHKLYRARSNWRVLRK